MTVTDRRFTDLLLGILMRRHIWAHGTSKIDLCDLDRDEYRQMREFVPHGDFFTFNIGKIVILDIDSDGSAINVPKSRYESYLAASDRARLVSA